MAGRRVVSAIVCIGREGDLIRILVFVLQNILMIACIAVICMWVTAA